jgi:NSS family neurotransmitter:Na+ symporter
MGWILAIFAGVAWFGLLFFAGITSSLAMGTPVMGFYKMNLDGKQKNSAWAFGLLYFY